MLSNAPSFSFFVSGLDEEVGNKSPVWQEPLPSGLSSEELRKAGYPTYGDYFLAVSGFILSDKYSCIDSSSPEKIEKISIHIEKHGAYYHPGRIHVCYINGESRNFVVNLAINEFARKTAKNEFEILSNLRKSEGGKYIPVVYGFRESETDSGSMLAMFTGDWLDGFHEFHFSGNSKSVVVWDPEAHFFLTDDQAREAYRIAAEVLTKFYNPFNYRQIYPWHHAAGDFIIRCGKDGLVDIRLITVRQYESLFNFDEEDSIENTIIGLIYFFLNMSIRMRIDRLDGIGEYVWADDFVLESTVKGFLDSAALMDIAGMTGSEAFEMGIKGFSEEIFFEMAYEMVSMYNPASPEISVIRENLENHSKMAHRLFSDHFNTI